MLTRATTVFTRRGGRILRGVHSAPEKNLVKPPVSSTVTHASPNTLHGLDIFTHITTTMVLVGGGGGFVYGIGTASQQTKKYGTASDWLFDLSLSSFWNGATGAAFGLTWFVSLPTLVISTSSSFPHGALLAMPFGHATPRS
jgi:hypothetical protein